MTEADVFTVTAALIFVGFFATLIALGIAGIRGMVERAGFAREWNAQCQREAAFRQLRAAMAANPARTA